MQLGDLTTLKNVRAWIAANSYAAGNSDTFDSLVTSLIPDISQAILNHLERPWILPRTYNDVYDSPGGSAIVLRNWPVLSVDSVAYYGTTIQPSQGPTSLSGYMFDQWSGIPPGSHQRILLPGGRFGSGLQGLAVSYTAGYRITDESVAILAPTEGQTTYIARVSQIYGMWGQDIEVKYVDGTPLTRVQDPPTESGTYYVRPVDIGVPLQPPGYYEFHESDAGQTVLVTYGFVPSPLERAATEWTAESLLSRQHIGEVSRSINQQITVKYDMSEIPAYIRAKLRYYKNVVPI